MFDEMFDYVIVGAGSAGCVLANRLTEDPTVRVALIEAGSRDSYFWIHVPLALAYVIGNPKVDWRFQTEPEPHLDGRRVELPRGKVLGGSSSINGMVYVRGQALDYDRWRQLGNAGWSWSDVLPYFKRSERFFAGANDAHGEDGVLPVSVPPVRWPVLDSYLEAAREAGVTQATDYNAGDGTGSTYFQATIHRGLRRSTARTFLRAAQDRPNLTVITEATVHKIEVQNRRAVGVTLARGGQIERIGARAEVLLSAGAYGSPQILQLSGIGPGALLQETGIPVVHDLPGVGENLQDHWQLRMTHRVHNTTTLNAYVQSAFGRAALGLRWLLFRTGPMAAQPPLLTVFHAIGNGAETPDVQIHVSAASYEKVGGPMDPFPGITSGPAVLRPTSLGHLRLRSADPTAAPAILHNYLATDYDKHMAVRAVQFVRKIAGEPALAPYAPQEMVPGAAVQTEEQILDFARRALTTVFHPVGTCAMGQSARAVVDAQLRVHGIDGLRVVDASIMPLIPSGNTNAPTIMIAEKAADMIRQSQRRAAA